MEDEEQELEREPDEDLYHPNEHKEQLGRTWNKMDRAQARFVRKRPLSAQKVERQASLDYDWPKNIMHVQDGLF